MKPLGILALAAQFAPRVFQIRRGTWIALSLGLLSVFVLLIWAAVSLFGWLWGQGRSLGEGAPEAARAVVSQVEQAVPEAREALGGLIPALKPEPPPRDVSGFDVGPVARYPGLSRSHWHRDGREITVRYEGRADYAAVLEYYLQAFAAQGYTQQVLSATPEGEMHEYLKGNEKVRFKLAQPAQGQVKATLIADME